jgi:hypothetical protein
MNLITKFIQAMLAAALFSFPMAYYFLVEMKP